MPLAKLMDKLMKFVNRVPSGVILLEDGKSVCKDVVCARGALVEVSVNVCCVCCQDYFTLAS